MQSVNELTMRLSGALLGFIGDERGDTNFISIIVILGIVAILAGIFMGFQEQIVGWAETHILEFFN